MQTFLEKFNDDLLFKAVNGRSVARAPERRNVLKEFCRGLPVKLENLSNFLKFSRRLLPTYFNTKRINKYYFGLWSSGRGSDLSDYSDLLTCLFQFVSWLNRSY